jgi:hypothetical protein
MIHTAGYASSENTFQIKDSDTDAVITLQQRVEVLVGRVIELERIVTDNNFELRHEINQL